MPDRDITEHLTTQPPDPEFIASTRQMLRSAWQAPLGQPPAPTEPVKGSTDRYRPRWITVGAAAGLVALAIGAVVLLARTDGNVDQAAIPTDAPTIAPVATVANAASTETTSVPPTTGVVSATPPPASPAPSTTEPTAATTTTEPAAATTTAAPAAATTTIAPTAATTTTTPTVLPSTTTAAAPQTTTSTPTAAADDDPVPLPAATTTTNAPPADKPTSIYTRTAVPQWAQINVTDPVSKYAKDGIYAAVGANSRGTAQLAQVFIDDACLSYFAKNPAACANGYAYEHDPELRTIELDDDTPVIAPFATPHDGTVFYEVPAYEFARLVRGSDPDPSAPAGIQLIRVSIGSYGIFRLRDGVVTTIVYPSQYTP